MACDHVRTGSAENGSKSEVTESGSKPYVAVTPALAIDLSGSAVSRVFLPRVPRARGNCYRAVVSTLNQDYSIGMLSDRPQFHVGSRKERAAEILGVSQGKNIVTPRLTCTDAYVRRCVLNKKF